MKNFLFALVCMTLVACGGGSSDNGSNPPTNTDYFLKTFEVVGTSDDIGGAAPISPNINNGSFTLQWEVNSVASLYKVKAFVSDDDILSETDIEFYSKTCLLNDCGQNTSYNKGCLFNNNNDIWCGTDEKTNLQDFLNGIPKDAYIILESCGASGVNCFQGIDAIRFE